MKKKDLEEKLFDLIHGELPKDKEDEIVKELEGTDLSIEELEALKAVVGLLKESPLPEPSEKMDKRFYAMLEDEKHKILLGEPEIRHQGWFLSSLAGPGLKVAAGISLFLLGWFASGWFGAGSEKSRVTDLAIEVSGLRETLVLTMMQQSSTVERIRAVNMAGEFENINKPVVTGLLNLLNNDSNDNVRLLALDALTRYSEEPQVREGLVLSIENQLSPVIQMRLAEIMLYLNEKRAVPEFQKILQNARLDYNVRGKMNDAIVVLL
jgi:hypothetical protein